MLDWLVVESSTDQSFGGEDCILRVGDSLSFGSRADKSFPVFGKGDD
jgi:hypothetical protein